MRSPSLRALAKVTIGVLFPISVGASGCCGCPIGCCSTLFSGLMHSPPPPPPGLPPTITTGVGGGGGGEAEGEGGSEAPLAPESGQAEREASRQTAKSPNLYADKRTPIRGALLGEGGKTRFVPHTADGVASVGDGSRFVVAGATGLWEHDTKSLAKLSRLVSGPVRDVASSPDGKRIAYALSGGRVRVVGYPGLKSLASLNIDEPVRMRFSADGQRLATGSESDTVTLIDIASSSARSFDTDEDVNDVFPMPDKPSEVAYASDDDEIGIVDVKAGRKVLGTESIVETWRKTNRPFFTMRDQQAVAYDSITNTLLGGGDDNMLWRFDDIRATPSVRSPVELGGNVVEIACCAGKTAGDRAAFVAVDDLRVRAVALDGRMGPEFGPIMSSVGSFRIRIALLPSGDVLVVPQHVLFRWEPRAGVAVRSNDYAKPLAIESALDADTVFTACDGGTCVVHRVAHGPAAADVETTIIGDLPVNAVLHILDFGDGTRAFAGDNGGKLRLVYLPKGGALEAPIDTPAVTNTAGVVSNHFAKKDGSTHGFVNALGEVYEITAAPRDARKIGVAAGSAHVTAFSWDKVRRKWSVTRLDQAPVFVP